ncbi:hypothetical protein DVH24_001109 [Malus domestica]|uniref:DYW domain-containing protein n=1 Tax=Malus domestica TaxID=3750 RepID=A0A498K4G6_MALDO|nr:hypothetical protein DVH24_001109 [Malus domestica]
MPVKNLVSWNAMISGYVENCRAEEGWKVFRSTIGYGVRPNPNLSALQMGKQVHQLSYKFQLYNDTTAGTSLVSTYCKCGNLEDAWKLFVEMEWKDIVTWNAMIAGYAQHGAGLVDLGVQYFDSMGKDYVQAKPDHYTCMVDLLGRAENAIGTTFCSILIQQAQLVMFNLLMIMWRMGTCCEGQAIDERKLGSEDTWSVVHEFRSGDRARPELVSIRERLLELDRKMKVEGYVQDLEFALHDIGEEHKRQLLLWHSEKLAIAFGILKVLLGTRIRIFKNSRVCGDCHRATKYISAIRYHKVSSFKKSGLFLRRLLVHKQKHSSSSRSFFSSSGPFDRKYLECKQSSTPMEVAIHYKTFAQSNTTYSCRITPHI